MTFRQLERLPTRRQVIEWVEDYPLDSDFGGMGSQELIGALKLKAKMAASLMSEPSCTCDHGTLYGDDPEQALVDLCTSINCGCENDLSSTK